MRPKVGVVFIGTNKYVNFFPKWKQAVDDHFLNECDKTLVAFSDGNVPEFNADHVVVFNVPPVVWPEATLYRYKFVNEALNSGELPDLDYIFYLDGDLFPVQDIRLEDITSEDKPLTGVHHPGNATNPSWNTFERRGISTADVGDLPSKLGAKAVYHQGCLWGGKINAVKKMVETLDRRITEDESNGIHAVWYDESQMNKYFLENIDQVNTVSWLFAFPEVGSWHMYVPEGKTPMMVHVDKDDSAYPRYPSDGKTR